ncbi:MAG: hypothetical protein LBQ19_01340, partial [Synergistaceae bacterium]|nr:hypothetical protein [Synergistaceae bacterium]
MTEIVYDTRFDVRRRFEISPASMAATTRRGDRATRQRARSRPILSPSAPIGDATIFATPHEMPITSELAVLRDSGTYSWAMASVTGLVAE